MLLAALGTLWRPVPVAASTEAADGPYFGDGNLPPGCSTRAGEVDIGGGAVIPRFLDDCYHMRVGLNGLDSPKIDVLLAPPVSPYPERDLRVMRQSIEMWEAGIDYLAPYMGLDWLSEGVDFEVFLGHPEDEQSTEPLWFPKIVVVSTNPVGGAGIGIDPLAHIFGTTGPCHGVPNPLASFADWEELPGFVSSGTSGTLSMECSQGGSVCFAVNGAIDPAPGVAEIFGLYDLVSHEVGHCLSVGHVGDAADHEARRIPRADIMSYTPQDHSKCVSTQDVEGFAIRMSRFLLGEPLEANHVGGPYDSFQIQHPSEHLYASSTGKAEDCPQPDAGLLPGDRVDFTPERSEEFGQAPPPLEDEDLFECVPGGPVLSDAARDTAYVTVLPGSEGEVSVPEHHDAYDILEASADWDPGSEALTFRIRVADLTEALDTETASVTYQFNFDHVDGFTYYTEAYRGLDAPEGKFVFGELFFNAGPDRFHYADVAGSFDTEADTIEVTVSNADLPEFVEPFAEGQDLGGMLALTRPAVRTDLTTQGIARDNAESPCRYLIGTGAVDVVVEEITPSVTLEPGGTESHAWESDEPYTNSPPLDALLFGYACDSRTDPKCQHEHMQVNVPEGGLGFEVSITSPTEGADFDLFLFGPEGERLASSGEPDSEEHISFEITQSGVYTASVLPWSAQEATFTGTASIASADEDVPEPSPPAPEDEEPAPDEGAEEPVPAQTGGGVDVPPPSAPRVRDVVVPSVASGGDGDATAPDPADGVLSAPAAPLEPMSQRRAEPPGDEGERLEEAVLPATEAGSSAVVVAAALAVVAAAGLSVAGSRLLGRGLRRPG